MDLVLLKAITLLISLIGFGIFLYFYLKEEKKHTNKDN